MKQDKENCRDKLRRQYELYIEFVLSKTKIPRIYLIFAVFFASIGTLITLGLVSDLAYPLAKQFYYNNLGFLWAVSVFMILIMIRRLRDVSLDVFICSELYFPCKVRNNMDNYLYAIFAPYKFKNEPVPEWFKEYSILSNRFFYISFISIILGIIFSMLSYFDFINYYKAGLVTYNDVLLTSILGFIGVTCAWVASLTLVYIILGLMILLRKISNESYKFQIDAPNSIIQVRKLNIIHMNLLYSYSALIIGLPSILSGILNQNYERYLFYSDLAVFLLAPFGFFIVLILPGIYIHKTIKNCKEFYESRTLKLIKDLEVIIYNDDKSNRYIESCIAYNAYIHAIDRIDKIRTWPFDMESILKIVVTFLASIVSIIQLILYNMI
ncbi:hypothetical protein P0O24_00010 [Methanotrichaceae archaeon M04Ac]|uniref:Uncharacterized protein n=1 Tax=Candidatus Methanocrinis alkalitolerans TaxID=3033395 RepID=A0ABT5XB88_9EURY|nr:hypothetical protein [Candidatus Methanocrinis alkalitolerans]MCC7572815.1 hypothetical protein [Methanofastidiosum sp.]MDF0591971.1 hypothetical protein [Candidatus Methanocrinis alkalitolerans]